ncbi:putative beta-lysine N-acetyltransferase [Clostridium sp. AWRP]|uniref:putative beta-lysine N-acetyltransferase n=1 Tax=Clostridium sp. AWRP TaxID=2212991 RepID=UPI000FDB22CD|nr:putative beta-lysine N-acetyltransferase [Clostridium sp. AWRP]AZV58535.1 putative beta-lysine N-acetyltransferase [Clostridium sp. AWRP]
MKINYDKTEIIGNSIINHGKYNNRIYLMKLDKNDYPKIVSILGKMAVDNGYTKIFAKIPYSLKDEFINNGYIIEANIHGFYNGIEDAIFISKYFSKERSTIKERNEIEKIINFSKAKDKINTQIKLEQDYQFYICGENDIDQMCKVYKEVFKTYPFPIHDPKYVKETMDNNSIYFSIKVKDKIVSLASTEMDYSSKSVEMTDFATLPQYRGHGFSIFLLKKMEEKMRRKNFYAAFTIARALSYGMNVTFSKLNYNYGGTLINNTNISGELESMNIWYKILSENK